MSNLDDLTIRERAILRMIIAGKSNKVIAKEVYISEKTVEYHLSHIYNKIGVRTRLLAGVWAIQHGLEAETRQIRN